MRIEGNLDDLGVASMSTAHLLIGRIGHASARITRNYFFDAAQVVVDRFQAPETAPRQRRDLLLPGRVHTIFSSHCRALVIAHDSKADSGEDRNCGARREQNRFHKITSLSNVLERNLINLS